MNSMNFLDAVTRQNALAERARTHRPRLFALHGLDATTEREILGWGMEFTHEKLAVLYLPTDSATYHTESAERAAMRYNMIGDIELTWL
jgi:hypothetical protein